MQKKVSIYFQMFDRVRLYNKQIKLATITPDQLADLRQAIQQQNPDTLKCIKTLQTNYCEEVTVDPEWEQDKKIDHQRYALSPRFPRLPYLAPCYKVKHAQNEIEMACMCARNLRNGKCRDEFVRRTLGAVLFPQFYAQDKQK